MGYTSVGTFVDGQIALPVSAANLNHIDGGIVGHEARITNLEGSSATLTDLIIARSLNTGAFTAASGGGSERVFVAPFPLQIVSVSIVTQLTLALSVDNVNFWTVTLRKGQTNVFATKTNQLTGGVAFTADVDTNFDSIVFDPANSQFAKGDVMKVYEVTSGTPAASWPSADITVRYQPL